MRVYFLLVMLVFLSACTKFTNPFDELAYECGESSSSSAYNYTKIFTEEGFLGDSASLRVSTTTGQNRSELLTSRGCLKIPGDRKEAIIVAQTQKNRGALVFIDPKTPPLPFVVLKTYNYKTLDSECRGDLATRSFLIKVPVNLSLEEIGGYSYNISLTQAQSFFVSYEHFGNELPDSLQIDLSQIPDGEYEMILRFKQMFSVAAMETEFRCQFFVDRKQPVASINKEFIRLDNLGEPQFLRVKPGEEVKLQIVENKKESPISVYYCLSKEDGDRAVCRFTPMKNREFTAPESGSWYLQFFARDEAGNEGELVKIRVKVIDDASLDSILQQVEKLRALIKLGEWQSVRISSIELFEKYIKLKTEEEKKLVAPEVESVIFEASKAPFVILEEAKNTFEQNTGLGVIGPQTEPVFVQLKNHNILEFRNYNGEKTLSLDLGLKGTSLYQGGIRYCEKSRLVVSFGQRSVTIIESLENQKEIELTSDVFGTQVGISDDCKFIFYQTRREVDDVIATHLYEIASEKFYQFSGAFQNVQGALTIDGKTYFLMQKEFGMAELYSAGSSEVAIDVRKLLDLPSGSRLGILKKDRLYALEPSNRFSIYSTRLDKLLERESVYSVIESSDSFEIGLLKGTAGLEVFDLETCKQTGKVDGTFDGTGSVGLGSQYVTLHQRSSGSVLIYSRTNQKIEEFYNKEMYINRSLFNYGRYLWIESTNHIRIFDLLETLQKRIVPSFSSSVGLRFTGGQNTLEFRTLESKWLETGGVVFQSQISKWNWNEPKLLSHSQEESVIPTHEGVDGYTPYISFLTEGVDVRLESRTAHARVSGFGKLGFYSDVSSNASSKTLEICKNWILSLAYSPAKDTLAAACQDGSIFLIDLQSQEEAPKRFLLSEFRTNSIGIYPIQVKFDHSGEYLYVSDSAGALSLMKVEGDSLAFDKTEKINSNLFAIGSSSNLIAVAGSDGYLKIFDKKLNLIRKSKLLETKQSMNTGIAFAPDESEIAISYANSSLLRFKLASYEVIAAGIDDRDGARQFVYDPTGQYLAFSAQGLVQVWDLDLNRLYHKSCEWLRPRLVNIGDRIAKKGLCQST